jgi:hypothetical protein
LKIVFPHIPKCAGSSLRDQLIRRKHVYLDYLNHPTWVDEKDKRRGRRQQRELQERLAKLNEWVVFGHFASSAYDHLPYDLKIVLLRDPLERAVSHFHYIRDTLPDRPITRRRHHEVAPIKEGRMSLDEFLELEHIRLFYSNYYLKNLQLNERVIVLSVEDLGQSLEKLANRCGLSLSASVHVNKGRYRGVFENFRTHFATDTELYKQLLGS